MATTSTASHDFARGKDEAKKSVNKGVEALARSGYAAKGVVYLTIGVLSALAAFQSGTASDAAGSRDALSFLGSTSYGTVLLWAMAIGLAGYFVWRMVQALFDPEHRGTDAKAIFTRIVLFISGVLYGSLGLWVFRTLTGNGGGSSGGSDGAQSWSAKLLEMPAGAWILGAFGLAVIGYGIAEFVKAYRAEFEKKLKPGLSGDARRLFRKVARFGLVSRGIVFLMIGGFLVVAAVQSDSSEARGLEGALQTLAGQSYGPWLMGVVALGLAGYGVLQLVKARYRRIRLD